MARGRKTSTLYMTSSPRDTIAVAEAGSDVSLWHHKLGHMSEKGMKMLLSKRETTRTEVYILTCVKAAS